MLKPWHVSRVTDLLAAPSVDTLTAGRIGAIIATLLALTGAVIAGRALSRAARHIGAGHGRRGAITALVLAPIGIVIGGIVVVTAEGGLGTGNGYGGGMVAIAVGVIGMALGGMALARTQRMQ